VKNIATWVGLVIGVAALVLGAIDRALTRVDMPGP
jgi:hypothetical protein